MTDTGYPKSRSRNTGKPAGRITAIRNSAPKGPDLCRCLTPPPEGGFETGRLYLWRERGRRSEVIHYSGWKWIADRQNFGACFRIVSGKEDRRRKSG